MSYSIERFSPWYGFVEKLRKLRFAAWTIRYWQAGPLFRRRMVRTTLAFAVGALVCGGLLMWA